MASKSVKICLNGHIIDYEIENEESFCRDCGAPLITSCPACGAELPKQTYYVEYDYNYEPYNCYNAYVRPNFCPFCSEPSLDSSRLRINLFFIGGRHSTF